MEDTSPPLSREERLAAKLRENLRRRKAQARAKDAGAGATKNVAGDAGNAESTRALSKEPQKS